MFCPKCGTKIPDDSDFCYKCGAPTDTPLIKTDPAIPGNDEISTENHFSEHFAEINSCNATAKPNLLHKIKHAKKNTKILIVSGAIVLIALAVLLTIIITNKDHTASVNDTSGQYNTTVEAPSNKDGNTPANIICRGLATVQNDTIYYVQIESTDTYIIKSMDINGGNEKNLYTLENFPNDLNIIGSNLYFVSLQYDDDDNISGSDLCCYNTNDSTVKTLYTSSNEISNLYVTNNQLYFIDFDDNDAGKIISINSNGSNAVTIKEKDDLYFFIINDSSIYYACLDTINRCDLNGDNDQKIYTTSSNSVYSAYTIDDSKLYVATYNIYHDSALKVMDLDGNNQITLKEFDDKAWICNLIIVDNQIYYTSSTLNSDFESTDGELCRMDLDGSNEKTITSKDNELSYFNIVGHWLFYYNEDKNTLTKLNLLNI